MLLRTNSRTENSPAMNPFKLRAGDRLAYLLHWGHRSPPTFKSLYSNLFTCIGQVARIAEAHRTSPRVIAGLACQEADKDHGSSVVVQAG